MGEGINYSQVDLFEYLYNLFVGKVSNQVYSVNVPTQLETPDKNDFLVLSIPYGDDELAFGKVKVIVELYVRAKSRGRLDLLRFKDLEKKLYAVIDEQDMKDTTPYKLTKTNGIAIVSLGEKDNVQDYHSLIYSFNVLIKE